MKRRPALHSLLLACALLVGALLVVALPALSQVPDAPLPALAQPANTAYTGDDACRDCHRQQWESYGRTAHHVASRLPTDVSILGSFSPGTNVMTTSNPYLQFVMTGDSTTYYQTALVHLPPSDTLARKESFDLVIGSGRKGQTYLYWQGENLFELPVSYWTATGRWINSPGYADGLPNWDKPVVPRCLECHVSQAAPVPAPFPLTRNRFDRASIVLGITCERCHGPGGAHVRRSRAGIGLGPGQTEDILNPARLSRERQMDGCALCHAGPGTPRAPAFSFHIGDDISQYLSIPAAAPDAPDDVHGHQWQQLRASRCYVASGMTCSTCHDVHVQQRDLEAFSQRCLSCHQAPERAHRASIRDRVAGHCVQCHMPLGQSKQIVLDRGGEKVHPEVRTHRIAVYPDAPLR